ncbi:MAG TPA: response regulator [Acidimicrobiales bacterium]|nr:response regulator [Acidimicrobiales bacterium]
MKVLVVVEDEEDMRRMIFALLTRDPRLVVTGHATTAAEAIEAAASLSPGLIVLDHFIEGPVTGLEAAPSLKQVAPAAKIILFSAHDLSSEARRSPDIDAYLQKDQPQKLLPLAQSLLGLGPIAA